MTEIKVVEKSLKMWRWLYKNFPAKKENYPEYYDIALYIDLCPLCSFYDDACSGCPAISCKKFSNFHIWCAYVYENMGEYSLAKLAAKNIYTALRKKLKELKDV